MRKLFFILALLPFLANAQFSDRKQQYNYLNKQKFSDTILVDSSVFGNIVSNKYFLRLDTLGQSAGSLSIVADTLADPSPINTWAQVAECPTVRFDSNYVYSDDVSSCEGGITLTNSNAVLGNMAFVWHNGAEAPVITYDGTVIEFGEYLIERDNLIQFIYTPLFILVIYHN